MLKTFLTDSRDRITNTSANIPDSMCLELGIITEPVRHIRREKQCPEKKVLKLVCRSRTNFEEKIYLSTERVVQEITSGFEQLLRFLNIQLQKAALKPLLQSPTQARYKGHVRNTSAEGGE